MKNPILTCTFSLLALISFSQEINENDTITKLNAQLITSFDKSDIESMVTYYFASRIRGDEKWKEVLPDPSLWTDRMIYSIEKHNQLNFTKYKNLGFYEGEYGAYVKVFIWVEMNGKSDGGIDDVTLKQENGQWIIWKVPI